MKNGENSNDKAVFFSSLKFKVMMLAIAVLLLANGANMLIALPKSRQLIKEQAHNAMISMTEAYERVLEYNLTETNGEMPVEMLASILSEAKLDGVSSSYSYLVGRDSTMLYHPTESKIGQPVENAAVKQILGDMDAGKRPKTDVIVYDFKGVKKYAAFAILSNDSILVMTADEKEILGGTIKMRKQMIIGDMVILLIGAALCLAAVGYMMRALDVITGVIKDTSEFNFTKNPASARIVKRKDEIGVMGRAIQVMRGNLRGIVDDLKDVRGQISSNVGEVKSISVEINNQCTDNSATTQELAAGMQETSMATDSIRDNIEEMKNGAQQIKDLAKGGEDRSHEVRKRAEDLKKTTSEAADRTTKMYEDISRKTEQAIESSKAVEKINELTGAIMSISSQTSLLALNASIEAARAGEAGRGFAVVATEIGNLANQTSETVGNINTIVNDVNNAVDTLAQSLKSTVEFLEKVVLKDYSQFAQVGENYSQDSQVYSGEMVNIGDAVKQLTETIAQIADSINGINTTVNEAAEGITEIADKTTNVVEQTVKNNALVAECIESVGKLDNITAMFTLE